MRFNDVSSSGPLRCVKARLNFRTNWKRVAFKVVSDIIERIDPKAAVNFSKKTKCPLRSRSNIKVVFFSLAVSETELTTAAKPNTAEGARSVLYKYGAQAESISRPRSGPKGHHAKMPEGFRVTHVYESFGT